MPPGGTPVRVSDERSTLATRSTSFNLKRDSIIDAKLFQTMQAIQMSMPLAKKRQVRPMGGWENKVRGEWNIQFFILPSFEGPFSALNPDSVASLPTSNNYTQV